MGEAAAAGGVAESSGAAGIFQAAGILPALGSVVAFGVGTVIGSEICHVIGIEGCWYFGSEGADPVPIGPPAYTWTYQTSSWPLNGAAGTVTPPYTYLWVKVSGGARSFRYPGYYGVTTATNTPPCGAEFTVTPKGMSIMLEGDEEGTSGCHRGVAARYAMENRTLDYHATDDPGISNYSYTAPGNWSEKLAGQIKGHEGDPAARVGQRIASKIAGSEVKNPYGTYVEIPDCDGLIYAACEDLLEQRGLTPERVTRTWETADPNGEPEEVLELDPAKATEVEKGTAVKVTTNPTKEGMPIVIPQPKPGEKYGDYISRLNPGLSPERRDLEAPYVEPGVGPNVVVRTAPEPGTRLDPGTTHKVEVTTNPPDVPVPAAGPGGGSCGEGIGAIDWSPLNQPLGSKFPFGVFGFFVAWIGEWESGEGVEPKWSVPLVPNGVFGSDGIEVDIDLGFMQPMVNVVRTIFLFASFVGLLWFLGTAAAKLQGDGS